ncbi:MAG: hypothetical protein LBM77_06460 [Spirochaetaceae bacterium]|jgi:hypothetical protein|nr:hypothetical protein [Spirochaetaceae bacterium]
MDNQNTLRIERMEQDLNAIKMDVHHIAHPQEKKAVAVRRTAVEIISAVSGIAGVTALLLQLFCL